MSSTSSEDSAQAEINVIQALTVLGRARAASTATQMMHHHQESASVSESAGSTGGSGSSDSGTPLPVFTTGTGSSDYNSTSGGGTGGVSFEELANTGADSTTVNTVLADVPAVIPVMSQAELEVIQKLKKFKENTYVKPASPESIADAKATIDNLKTAIETKMEAAVIGVLNSMNISMSNSMTGESNRAYVKANAATVVIDALVTFNSSSAICENAMQTCALMCRYSDENKSSVCLENAKALGSYDGYVVYVYLFFIAQRLIWGFV